jgi:predicted O-methyltransferase YrrM
MLQKLFSYIIPLTIFKQKSNISHSLEVTWANGELVLDSSHTNYSYGSLQRILKKGLINIGFEKIRTMQDILVLGVAGGSVIKTLVNDISFKGKITGIEIDPAIITIANTYFKLNEIQNLEVLIDDASEFVLKTENKYDLVIIDIFQDSKMPDFLFKKHFIQPTFSLLKSEGVILFNTMILNQNHNQRNSKFIAEFKSEDFNIRTIPRIKLHNELIIIEKVS